LTLTATVHASQDTAASLGVLSWEVYDDDAKRTIVARDASGATAWKISVDFPEGDDGDHVQLTALEPESATLTLARDGSLEGIASDRFQSLATHLFTDIETSAQTPKSAAPLGGPETTTTLNDRAIADQGDINLGWSLFGYSYDTTLGDVCRGGFTRTAYSTYVYNGTGNCYVKTWLNQNPYDCRVIVHVGESATHTATCHWATYQYSNGF
jgi:hypothetical protein